MSFYTSEVGICNQALSWVGGNRITSLDDDTTEAHLCTDNYEFSRDTVLDMRHWTFAAGRVQLNPLIEPPDFGWAYQCVIPTDTIAVREVSNDPDFLVGIPWEREENLVKSNVSDPYMKYTKRITDVTRFSALFIKTLAAQIAADIAVPLTSSTKLADKMMAKMDYYLEQAGGMDGVQGKNKRLRSTELTRVR